MYGGADDNVAEHVVDKSGDVVIRLTSLLFVLGYHIYTYNYYTSVPLAMYLYTHRTYLSVRPNRCGLPEPVKRNLTKKGNIVRRVPHLAFAFEDRKHVAVLSTHGSGCPIKYMSRRNTKHVTTDCIHQHNLYMGGVNIIIYLFQDERRMERCNVKVFPFYLATLLNAFIVYRSNTAVPMSYRKFLKS